MNAGILICEPLKIIALDLKITLMKNNFKVITIFDSADKVIEFCGIMNVDLLITDLKIKGSLNGMELAEAVQKLYHIPSLILASTDSSFSEQFINSKVTNYILKPYNEAELLHKVEKSLVNGSNNLLTLPVL